MKRCILLILVPVILLSIVACGSKTLHTINAVEPSNTCAVSDQDSDSAVLNAENISEVGKTRDASIMDTKLAKILLLAFCAFVVFYRLYHPIDLNKYQQNNKEEQKAEK